MSVEGGHGVAVGRGVAVAPSRGPVAISHGPEVGRSHHMTIPSPTRNIATPKPESISHKFGQGSAPHESVLGRVQSIDTRKYGENLANFKTIAKFNNGLRPNEVRRNTNYVVRQPSQEIVNNQKVIEPTKAENSKTDGFGQPNDKRVTSADSRAQHFGINDGGLGGVPKKDQGDRPVDRIRYNRVVKESLKTGDTTNLMNQPELKQEAKGVSAEPLSTPSKNDVMQRKEQYVREFIAPSVSKLPTLEANASATRPFESFMAGNNHAKSNSDLLLVPAERAAQEFDSNAERSVIISQTAALIKENAPPGSEWAKIDPDALGVKAFEEGNRHIKKAIVTAVEIGVKDKQKLEDDLARNEEEEVEEELKLSSTPLVEDELIDQVEVSQGRADDVLFENEDIEDEIEYVQDEQANEVRTVYALEAANTVLDNTQNSPTTGPQIAALMPSGLNQPDEVKSQIIRGNSRDDRSYADFKSAISQIGEVRSTQEIGSQAIKLTTIYTAVRAVPAPNTLPPATEEEVMRVLNDRIVLAKKAA